MFKTDVSSFNLCAFALISTLLNGAWWLHKALNQYLLHTRLPQVSYAPNIRLKAWKTQKNHLDIIYEKKPRANSLVTYIHLIISHTDHIITACQASAAASVTFNGCKWGWMKGVCHRLVNWKTPQRDDTGHKIDKKQQNVFVWNCLSVHTAITILY